MAKSKRRRKRRDDSLVFRLILIVAVVLVVFEGRLVVTMVTFRSSENEVVVTVGGAAGTTEDGTAEKDTEAGTSAGTKPVNGSSSREAAGTVIAGLPAVGGRKTASVAETEPEKTLPTVSNPESAAIVKKMDTPVDDSYFSDAVFIGDSRMQGFQNASGITQGTFFTSVGMALSAMTSKEIIQTPQGNITVAAALSGGSYKKIYIMLGTNDLGEYDWESFRTGFISCTQRFHEIQPNAVFYICSVIYVDESKVASSEYVNNTNVDKINRILLEICEQERYNYLDLNEMFSNGYGSLIDGASSDGVHLYPQYCQQMLTYMKEHYVPDDSQEEETEAESESETETEKEKEKEKEA